MNAFAQTTGRKLFERNLKQYEAKDPLYETYVDDRGRQRRRKREIPAGLSKRDIKVLRSVQRRAHYLDKGFQICGMRFGWTFIIGIIPGAGDAADAALNYLLVVRKAKEAEIPGWLLSRMFLNNAVSAGVGMVPLVGDIILAMYKANSRNAALLEEYLRVRGEEFLKPTGERRQNAEDVRPGAGRRPGEIIPIPGDEPLKASSSTATTRFGSWFGKGSKEGGKNTKDENGEEPETAVGTPVLALTDSDSRGRFVEDVPPTSTEGSGTKRN